MFAECIIYLNSARNSQMEKLTSFGMKFFGWLSFIVFANTSALSQSSREHISINEGWSFYKYDSLEKADNLLYDVRPEIANSIENKVADAKPTEAVKVEATQEILKPWILPSGNRFIKDSKNRHIRPEGNPGSNF